MANKLIINGQEVELAVGSLLRLVGASALGDADLSLGSNVTTTDATPTTIATIPVPSSGSVIIWSLVKGTQSGGSNGFQQLSVQSARRSGAAAPTLSQGASGIILAALENTYANVKPFHQYVISGNNVLSQAVGKGDPATTILWFSAYLVLYR